nr:MAG TPA: hypothetical protein [Caudoviricetes sp.]
MATLDASSIDKFAFDFEELARLPDDVVEAMLEAEGEVIKAGQAETAKNMLQGPYNKGAVSRAPHLGKIKRTKDGKALYVSFAGTQHGTRVAEIAFLNEFGKQGQSPRQFIRAANEKYADKAVDAAERIYNQYLNKHGF